MKLKYVVDALNKYYSNKFPNATGWFIGKEIIEPTKLNAYKKYKIEIYYHRPGKNYLAYTQQIIDRCPEGAEDDLKEKMIVTMLSDLFTSLNKFDEYEAV